MRRSEKWRKQTRRFLRFVFSPYIWYLTILEARPWRQPGLRRAVVVCALAAGVGLVCPFGRDVDMQFYVAMAQIVPVLLVAAMLEVGAVTRRDKEMDEETVLEESSAEGQALVAEEAAELEEQEEPYRPEGVPPPEGWFARLWEEEDEDEPNPDDMFWAWARGRQVVVSFLIAGFTALAATLIALVINASTTFLFLTAVVSTARLAAEMVQHYWYRSTY